MLNVLFLDSRNASHSLIAEAILRADGRGRFHAYSAGSTSRGTASPEVIAFLRDRSLPTDGLRSKGLNELVVPEGPAFAFVITLSETAAASAGERRFNGDPVVAHWPLETEGDDVEPSVWDIRDSFWVLSRRIKIFASLPHGKATRRTLERRLQALQSWQ